MPGFTHMISGGLDELGKSLIAQGTALRKISWATRQACRQLCFMYACLDALADKVLPPEAKKELEKTREWMDSPEHEAKAIRAFATLGKMMEERSPDEVEKFKKDYEKRAQRQQAAVDRIRSRKRRT